MEDGSQPGSQLTVVDVGVLHIGTPFRVEVLIP